MNSTLESVGGHVSMVMTAPMNKKTLVTIITTETGEQPATKTIGDRIVAEGDFTAQSMAAGTDRIMAMMMMIDIQDKRRDDTLVDETMR